MFSSALMVLSLFVAMPVKANDTKACSADSVACIGDQGYDSLQAAVTAAGKAETTIVLQKDIDLSTGSNEYVKIEDGQKLNIVGDGKVTIKLNHSAFNNYDNNKGLNGTISLTIKDVNFVGSNSTPQGYPVVLGFYATGTSVKYENCTFTNLYEGLYANNVADKNAKKNTVEFSNCSFENVTYYYGYDDGYTSNGRVDKHEFILNNVTSDKEMTVETFAVASVDGIGYTDLNAAITAAQSTSDKTVTLRKDVELNSMLTLNTEGMTLDLNNHQITGGTTFAGTGNAAHLVDITANNVTLKMVH